MGLSRKKLSSLLSDEVKEQLTSICAGDPPIKNLIYEISCDLIAEEQVEALESLFFQAGFEEFIRSRLKKSAKRLEDCLRTLLARIALEADPERIGKIAGAMASAEYRKIEKMFFVIPVDQRSYNLFEKGFIQVGEQNIDLVDEYCRFFGSDQFIFLRTAYAKFEQNWEIIVQEMTNLLLAYRSADPLFECAGHLLSDGVERLVGLIPKKKDDGEFLSSIFQLFYDRRDTKLFFKLINLLHRRYPPSLDEILFRRTLQLWPIIAEIQPEAEKDFGEYLTQYGNPKKNMEAYVWEVVAELPPPQGCRAITFLVSLDVLKIVAHYQSVSDNFYHNEDTVKFLIKNIIAALLELELKDFQGFLFPIVLKLLVNLKVTPRFISARADFFGWLKARTSSQRIELEVIRFIFFEYIFISLKIVPNVYNMVMTKTVDKNHAEFCRIIDDEYRKRINRTQSNIDECFAPLLKMLRNIVRKPIREKFDDQEHRLSELFSVAEKFDLEDALQSALDEVSPKHFINYHESFMDIFRTAPERLVEALAPDFWCRIEFLQAEVHAHSALLGVVGGMAMVPSEYGPSTDGRTIYLPPYLNTFFDEPEPLLENRNLSMYVALALHEAGHIIGGSFRFDLSYYLFRLEKPDLFRFIYNSFEDYRIEQLMIKIRAHPQVGELLALINLHYAAENLTKKLVYAADLLFYIYDDAFGYNEEVAHLPEHDERYQRLIEVELNTGRFRDMAGMIDYGIERLKNLNLSNPLAVYPLSREFYEIMKHWPSEYTRGLMDLEGTGKGIQHTVAPASGEKRKPLSENDLIKLYQECNENPRKFLDSYELPIFEELLPEELRSAIEAGAANTISGLDGESGEREPGSGGNRGEKWARRTMESYLNEMITAPLERHDYTEEGTIDFSHRTRADDLLSEQQKDKIKQKKKNPLQRLLDGLKSPEPKNKKQKKKAPKKKIQYSIDPGTKSRTNLTQVKEYLISDVDYDYLNQFKRWDSIARRVYHQLAFMMPQLDDRHDTSAVDGEINMELLLEILSEKSRLEIREFMDIYVEGRRTLKAIVGLDASGSTMNNIDMEKLPGYNMVTVLDIEKAFAMIMSTALSYLTDDIEIYAFNSITSTNVYRADTIRAISSFHSDAGNRDGDFIRYLADKLNESDSDVKYFFLISDGQPSSDNYYGKGALDDTLMAMREAVNSGIKLIYFNIDSIKGDYFTHFQKEATYAEYFNNPEELLPAIPRMVRSVVDSIK